jgi:hypothetical protein
MIVSKKDIADDYFDDAVEKNKVDTNVKNNYNNFSEKIDRYVNAIINELNYGKELIEQDKDLYKQLYKQVELMMINAQRILTLKSKKVPSIKTPIFYHPSEFANKVMATILWNNMFLPPEKKMTNMEFMQPLHVPTENDVLQ